MCAEASTYVDNGGTTLRDTDWFLMSIPPGGSTATLTCLGELLMLFGFVNIDDCDAPVIIVLGVTDGMGCTEASVSTFLEEGTYAAFAAPGVFDDAQCGTGNDYYLRLDCTSPNDLCVNAIPVSDGSTAFSTVGANTDGPAEES